MTALPLITSSVRCGSLRWCASQAAAPQARGDYLAAFRMQQLVETGTLAAEVRIRVAACHHGIRHLSLPRPHWQAVQGTKELLQGT